MAGKRSSEGFTAPNNTNGKRRRTGDLAGAEVATTGAPASPGPRTGSDGKTRVKNTRSTDMGPPPPPIQDVDDEGQDITIRVREVQRMLGVCLEWGPEALGSSLKLVVSTRLEMVGSFLRRLENESIRNKPGAETAERTFKPLSLPPRSAPEDLRDLVIIINETIIEIPTLYAPYILRLTAQPTPSSFAKPEVWAYYQEHGQPIMCLRPHDKRGVPLVMLHEVFRQFTIQVAKPLPSTTDAFEAKRVAQDLCYSMPDRFKDESARRARFNKVTQHIAEWRCEQPITADSEFHGGKVDAWHVGAESRVLVIREDKVEVGSGAGDPYMQASRDYQILVSRAKDEASPLISEGIPVFILILVGPLLWVCGGFWDGQFPVVEPLAHPCIMLPDFKGGREDMLARTLYALHQSIGSLNTQPLLSRSFNPGVPRVFQSFEPLVGDPQPITFLKRFDVSTYDRLMFYATWVKPQQAISVLVKFRSEPYGVAVHRHLATLSLAPAYHGHISLEETPTGHVMELMEPPNGDQPGWITLFTLGSMFKSQAKAYRDAIRRSLDKLLLELKAKSFVHGDLRSNNILIEVDVGGTPKISDGTAHIRVVDFDWAGTSGEVRYPASLNANITWPDGIGELIVCDHDQAMVDRWWKDEFSSDL